MARQIADMIHSISAKVGIIVLSMGAMTAAALYVGSQELRLVSGRIEHLQKTELPALKESTLLTRAAVGLRGELAELLIAEGKAGVQDTAAKTRKTISDLEAISNGLARDRSQDLRAAITAARRAIDALIAARMREFDTQAKIGASMERMRRLTEELDQALSARADTAMAELSAGGQASLAAGQQALERLVNVDIVEQELVLDARADVNLASGAMVALGSTAEPTLQATLADMGRAAVRDLDTIVPEMRKFDRLQDVSGRLSTAAGQIAGILDAGPSEANARRHDLLSLQKNVDSLLSASEEKIRTAIHQLSADAARRGESTSKVLAGGKLLSFRDSAELDSRAKTYLADALFVLTMTDVEQVRKAQPQLTQDLAQIRELSSAAPPEVRDGLKVLAALSDGKGGLVPERSAVLEARQQAAAASLTAADTAKAIVDLAQGMSDGVAAAVTETSNKISAEFDHALLLFGRIALASVVMLVLAQVLAWLMLARPLGRVTRATGQLAEGDLSAVDGLGHPRGEIGAMVRALGVFRDGLIQKAQLERDEKAAREASAAAEAAARREREEAEALERERQEARDRAERDRERAEQEKEACRKAAEEATRQAQSEAQARVVSALAEGMHRLSEGDLSVRIEEAFPEGYEALRRDFNSAAEALGEVMGSISDSVERVRSASEEISGAADDLSLRTEKSAVMLEESSAALTEMTQSVTQSAEQAGEADRMVTEARDRADTGQRVVERTIGAMQAIEASSSKIATIIDVIEDIAFQTNLLALNAGVEAARAGESGRGFAVVASEVRALAHRSSEAAREIGSLIGESGASVKDGVGLVNEVGSVLLEIAQAIGAVTDRVTQIASASGEQKTGISEINVAVGKLDISTQKNAAMVEETTAASHALSEEAMRLSALLRRFSAAGQGGGRSGRAGDGRDKLRRAG